MHITDDQLDRYRRQGFLIIENFLTEQERAAALDGFFSRFAPPYEDYVAAGRNNLTPRQGLFPWDHSGLNHVTVHPDLISAAERLLGTREIRLDEGHLGMKYAGEQYWTAFHIDSATTRSGRSLSRTTSCTWPASTASKTSMPAPRRSAWCRTGGPTTSACR